MGKERTEDNIEEKFPRVIYEGPHEGFYHFHNFYGAIGALEGTMGMGSEFSSLREFGRQFWHFLEHGVSLKYRCIKDDSGKDVKISLAGQPENMNVVENIILEAAKKYEERQTPE